MNRTKKNIFLTATFVIIFAASVVCINELNKTKLATLNIENVKIIISDVDFKDGSTNYGFDVYLDTAAYELDSDNYYIKVVLPETDQLDKHIFLAKRNIPQKVSPKGSFNIAAVVIDDQEYLKRCVGNKYELTLELYKGDIKQDSKVYTVLCEQSFGT